MKSVSERADPKTWTVEIHTKDGRLLDLQALSRCVRNVGDPFSVRGVEATIDGWLVKDGNHMTLRASGTEELLLLSPLQRKVQRDSQSKTAQSPTSEERESYKRLVASWTGQSYRIRIVGPLVKVADNAPLRLEVRQFTSVQPAQR